ncbi:MAG: sigma-54 dependent transcriptional regulator [Bacteroidales bacterium]|nr:sigma-54 dependent transcriptional regulator [Bacteroidales bacterium]
MKRGKILVVDDNQGIRSALKILLTPEFAEIETIASPKTLVQTMERMMPQVVLLDMNFNTDINTGNEGLFWTSELKKMFPDTQIVLFTAYADIALAVEGMKRGAFDFIVKPWDNEKLLATLHAAYEATPKAARKQTAVTAPVPTDMFWGDSAAMTQIQRALQKIAPTDATVLITGENGTGKDVLAREIHAHSLRKQKPMVCVDAGAIPESLFEGELFGHVKGAFTDAHSDHMGKFEQANGGTLFLDEIGNIPLHLQAKLLRVLQNRTVTRVGSEKQIPIDIRLICATNIDLEKRVNEGLFREDLYYRINTMHLHLPSLRDRANDILPLAERFMLRYAEKYRRPVSEISPEAAQLLRQHVWNGNIRELQNVIEKAVILSEGQQLRAADLSLHNAGKTTVAEAPAQTLVAAEEQTIRSTMARCNGNLSMVAKELGISRPTLYSKLKKYGI